MVDILARCRVETAKARVTFGMPTAALVLGDEPCTNCRDTAITQIANANQQQRFSTGTLEPDVSTSFERMLQAVARDTNAADERSKLCFDIQTEAISIISHFASLVPGDFAGGVPALLERLEPLTAPVILVNVGHVAATALLRAISCPGPNFPVIHALQTGTYICHVQYAWRGASIAVPIFRSL